MVTGYSLRSQLVQNTQMTSHDKHSNNSDTSQDLLALKHRGIDPFDGIDDDKGSKWHLFKDQLATATESGGKREKLLVYGNQAPVTNENVDVIEAGIMFAAIEKTLRAMPEDEKVHVLSCHTPPST